MKRVVIVAKKVTGSKRKESVTRRTVAKFDCLTVGRLRVFRSVAFIS